MTIDSRTNDKATRPTGVMCPMCEAGDLVARHCKSICERCGYVESCEDNFLPNQENPEDVVLPAS